MDISNLLNRPSVKELGERIANPVYPDWIKFMCILAYNQSFDSDREYSPSYALDQVWHQALLNPVLYVKVCHEVCVSVNVDLNIIDHDPELVNGSLDAYYDRLINTRWEYEKLFAEKPSKNFYDGGDDSEHDDSEDSYSYWASDKADDDDSYSESTEDDPIYTVKSLTGKKVDVTVSHNATAYDLLCKFCEIEKCPMGLVTFYHKGKMIANGNDTNPSKKLILSETITNDPIIYILNLRGC